MQYKSKFDDKQLMNIKVPIDDNGLVQCKMFECMWKPSGRPDRRPPTDFGIDALNKYLTEDKVKVIVIPVRCGATQRAMVFSSS